MFLCIPAHTAVSYILSVCVCIYRYVVSQILSGDTREEIIERIHTKLTNEAARVRAGEVSIDKFQIAKVGNLLFDVNFGHNGYC